MTFAVFIVGVIEYVNGLLVDLVHVQEDPASLVALVQSQRGDLVNKYVSKYLLSLTSSKKV